MITSCKNYSFIYLHLEKTAFSVFDIPAIKKLRQKEIEIDILVNKMMATLNNCSKQFCSLLFFFFLLNLRAFVLLNCLDGSFIWAMLACLNQVNMKLLRCSTSYNEGQINYNLI